MQQHTLPLLVVVIATSIVLVAVAGTASDASYAKLMRAEYESLVLGASSGAANAINQALQQAAVVAAKPTPFGNEPLGADFAHLFGTYMRQNKPYRGRMSGLHRGEGGAGGTIAAGDGVGAKELAEAVQRCGELLDGGEQAPLPLSLCLEVLDAAAAQERDMASGSTPATIVALRNLTLPALLTSNYWSRTNASSTAAGACTSTGTASSSSRRTPRNGDDIDYTRHWPVVLRLSPDSPTAALQCPSNMHAVLWAAPGRTDGTSPSALKVRSFPQTASTTSYFHPSEHYFAFPSDPNTPPSALLHQPSYLHSGFPKYDRSYGTDAEASAAAAALPRFSESSLGVGAGGREGSGDGVEYLFIPRNQLFSAMLPGADGGSDSGSALLFMHCLFDASNYHAVRAALTVEQHGSCWAEEHMNAMKGGSDGRTFDTTMDRTPADTTLVAYLAGHYSSIAKSVANSAAASASGDVGDESSEAEAVETTATEAAKPAGGRNRSRRGKSKSAAAAVSGAGAKSGEAASGAGARNNAVRDWQASKKWDMQVAALTLPIPHPPRIVQSAGAGAGGDGGVGRDSATLAWRSPFRPAAQDTTKFGFNLTLCVVGTVGDLGLGGKSSAAMQYGQDGNRHCTTYTMHRPRPKAAQPTQTTATTTVSHSQASGSPTTTITSETAPQVALTEVLDRRRSALQGAEVYYYRASLGAGVLHPATRYRYRLTLLYETAESNPTPWSDAEVEATGGDDEASIAGTERSAYLTTLPVTPPSTLPPLNPKAEIDGAAVLSAHQLTATSAVLTFRRPTDDGGSQLLGYNVYVRYPSTGEIMHHYHHTAPVDRPVVTLVDADGVPLDDGEWFAGFLNENMPSLWHWHDTVVLGRDDAYHASVPADPEVPPTTATSTVVTVIVSDLHPLCAVEFAVSSFNAYGTSPISVPSSTGASVLRMSLPPPPPLGGAALPSLPALHSVGVDLRAYGVVHGSLAGAHRSIDERQVKHAGGDNVDLGSPLFHTPSAHNQQTQHTSLTARTPSAAVGVVVSRLFSSSSALGPIPLSTTAGSHNFTRRPPSGEFTAPLFNWFSLDEEAQTVTIITEEHGRYTNADTTSLVNDAEHRAAAATKATEAGAANGDDAATIAASVAAAVTAAVPAPSKKALRYEAWGVHYTPQLIAATDVRRVQEAEIAAREAAALEAKAAAVRGADGGDGVGEGNEADEDEIVLVDVRAGAHRRVVSAAAVLAYPEITGAVLEAPPNAAVIGEGGAGGEQAQTAMREAYYGGRIVMLLRGGMPLVFKILAAQEAGAVGVIIIDDGTCRDKITTGGRSGTSLAVSPAAHAPEYDQRCIPGASKQRTTSRTRTTASPGERIGVNDVPTPWRKVRIPAVFVSQAVGLELLSRSSVDLHPHFELMRHQDDGVGGELHVQSLLRHLVDMPQAPEGGQGHGTMAGHDEL